LFSFFHFNVYARIDGFINAKGELFLNDPNTTSGMMPSSFFFHQAAEIGLNPSQFLTYILRTSLSERAHTLPVHHQYQTLLQQLDAAIANSKLKKSSKKRVAVFMGGYSTERHISVESGRNIYEKLASSAKYQPFPVFVTGNDESHQLYLIPINVMLKDNADDIKEKAEHFKRAAVVDKIIADCKSIIKRFGNETNLFAPKQITYKELSKLTDLVFIGLHGRPGEDGTVQKELLKYKIPFNGSGVESSQITINKYSTNQLLKKHGFLVADQFLVYEQEWKKNSKTIIADIEKVGYPLIAKPADDGCSSAVKKIKTREELVNYAEGVFRANLIMSPKLSEKLGLKPKEEFPKKSYFLVEKFVDKNGAAHFLEVTGGMLTSYDKKGKLVYESFEPSETLAESEILSLEEKFLAGQGQNITPARYHKTPAIRNAISKEVQKALVAGAKVLKVEGYCRIDAFVRIDKKNKPEVVFIEVNSLPGMTPATAIFHQCALNDYKPYEFIDAILEFGVERVKRA
jgi:D-alanine-D-alanine ligase